MTVEEMNLQLGKLQMPYGVSEYQIRQQLNRYLEDNNVFGLENSDIRDLFSYVTALRLPDLEEELPIDLLTIATAVHKQFTLAELASFPIPLPYKASGYRETSGRIMLNPKKIIDHYSLLSSLTDVFQSDKYHIEKLVRGVTVFNRYSGDLRLTIFSYDKCYVRKSDNQVYGHLFFNRFYSKEKVCELIPDLESDEFKYYNGTLPYVKDKSISEVIAIVKTVDFFNKCERRNNFVGSNYAKLKSEIAGDTVLERVKVNSVLRKKGLLMK